MYSAETARPGKIAAAKPKSAHAVRHNLSVVGSHDLMDPLIRSLALDRLRDLHDDGVTVDYIGRMYGVSGDRIRQIETELRA